MDTQFWLLIKLMENQVKFKHSKKCHICNYPQEVVIESYDTRASIWKIRTTCEKGHTALEQRERDFLNQQLELFKGG